MKDSNIHFVAEGKRDAHRLRAILKPHGIDARHIINGGGKGAAISGARTILALKHHPVVLVLDADTTNETEIREERERLQELLSSASGGSDCRAFLAVPTLDSIRPGSREENALANEIVEFVQGVTEQQAA